MKHRCTQITFIGLPGVGDPKSSTSCRFGKKQEQGVRLWRNGQEGSPFRFHFFRPTGGPKEFVEKVVRYYYLWETVLHTDQDVNSRTDRLTDRRLTQTLGHRFVDKQHLNETLEGPGPVNEETKFTE